MALKNLSKLYICVGNAQPFWNEYNLSATVTFSSSLIRRSLHFQSFTRNLQLITSEKLPDSRGFQVIDSSERERPLTLLYSWMLAKDTHLMKYAKLYTDKGIDVLKVRLSPFDLLRPTKGAQVAADNVLNFLHMNPSFSPLIVHGFSVGGYAFCETMVKVEKEMEKHEPILKRFIGQIWDSPVDLEGVPVGLSRAMTSNQQLQKYLEKYLSWYMKVNYKTATIHYENSSRMMHQNTLGAPGLFLFSKKDQVSTPEMNYKVIKSWEAKGMPVFAKCFENSAHVSHFHRYRKDYEEEISAFLETVGLLEPTKGRAVVG